MWSQIHGYAFLCVFTSHNFSKKKKKSYTWQKDPRCVLLVVITCSLVSEYIYIAFGRIYFFRFASTLKYCSKAMAFAYQITRCHNADKNSLTFYRYRNRNNHIKCTYETFNWKLIQFLPSTRKILQDKAAWSKFVR